MVMYRGASNVGKELDIVPHRKWQLEFHTEDFPDYEAILSRIGKPLHEAYGMTPLFTLRGTSEKTVLMTVPIYGPDGHFWGICGYEMRQSYFMSSRAQISKLPRLICLMAPKVTGSLEAGMGLGCGVKSGYYPEPDGSLAMRSFGGGLLLVLDYCPRGLTEAIISCAILLAGFFIFSLILFRRRIFKKHYAKKAAMQADKKD
jgi:hypothetical protein